MTEYNHDLKKTSPYVVSIEKNLREDVNYIVDNTNDSIEKFTGMNMNKIVDKLDDVGEDISFVTVKATNAVKNNVEIFYNGWKRFVFKDSIINIAVGMIIAKSFKNTVNSVVVDIIMPLIIGFGVGANVHDLFLVLVDGEEKKKQDSNITYITLDDAKRDGAVTLNYGLFINILFDLIFVTLCLYTALKIFDRFKKKLDISIKKSLSNI
tara:strand:+ start:376 stop:1002 length:627 start_codon:yes stop_codon:yes gene_type:complete